MRACACACVCVNGNKKLRRYVHRNIFSLFRVKCYVYHSLSSYQYLFRITSRRLNLAIQVSILKM